MGTAKARHDSSTNPLSKFGRKFGAAWTCAVQRERNTKRRQWGLSAVGWDDMASE